MQLAQIDIGQDWQLSGKTGGFGSLAEIVSFLLPKALLLGGVIFLIMIIIAGLGTIAGAGSDDPHKKEQARNFLTFGIIGLTIMFGAYWILQIINFLTGGTLKEILP